MRTAIGSCLLPSLVLLSLLACGRAREPQMVFPDADWEVATPESQGVNPAALGGAVGYLEENAGSDGVNELVVIRHGRLIWQGTHTTKVHGIWSITKAFTTLCLGLLIDDGKATLDMKASSVLPELAETYPDITMRHFATMTSGYRAVGDEPQGSYTHGPSKTPFEPSPTPLFTPPGSHYAYWDSAMNEFANVLTRLTGEPLADYFSRRIAGPIGMKNWSWGDFGEVGGVLVNGGSGNNSRHVKISSRELARLGHLFLNRGAWNGRQLVAPGWIEESVKVQVPASLPLGHLESGIDGRGTYGYNWWANGVKPDGTRKWPEAPLGTFSRSGYNNNDLFVVPEWNVVIVRLGLDEQEKEITDNVYSHFLGMVGQALASPE